VAFVLFVVTSWYPAKKLPQGIEDYLEDSPVLGIVLKGI
jgi:hypothetical protein